MMSRFKIAAVVAAASVSAAMSANAAVVFSFTPGGFAPTPGFSVVNDFESGPAGFVGAGAGFVIQNNNDPQGAPPASSVPFGTNYLSVLGGGTASYNFTGYVTRFQFDWGSLDSYNTLTINYTGGPSIVIPGTTFVNAANGNQVLPLTNGLFSVNATGGEVFTSISLASSQNSFEIDNLATGVPEPATWAMMIIGFGGVGSMLRSARRKQAAAFA